jgi:uncharacterized protein YhaN
MQNQILGFFIITSVCLGVLCGAQWRHLREVRSETDHLKGELADQALELDGKGAALDTFRREQQRLKEQLNASTAGARELERVTNSLIRRLDRARRYVLDVNGEEVGPLGLLLGGMLRDPVLADRLLAEELRAQLEGTPHPLEGAQAAELLELIAAERRQLLEDDADPKTPAQAGWVLEERVFQEQLQKQETLNLRVLGLARDLFLPDQLEALARSQTNMVRFQKYSFDWGRKRFREEALEAPAEDSPREGSGDAP